MGIKDWQKSGSRSVRLGRSYAEADRESHFWMNLWKKIKREKGRKNNNKKKSNSNSPVSLQPSYDHDTYLQNFDEESRWTEPDILYRSFSARFADPSRTFSRNVFVE